ncbi:MAG: hypothetical protein JWO36_7292 [Myxococcales bacterium]|nr:hypothetical protein [Myxococcales bacterium]
MRIGTLAAFAVSTACGSSGSVTDGNGAGSADAPAAGEHTLSDDHPGDIGLGADPAVVWFEDFEEASVAAVTARYNDSAGATRMQLVPDHVGGQAALALTAGGAVSAVHVYKQLPNHDELYVRWYVKYQAGVLWHHSGVWFGGYNPSTMFPNPQAGLRPNGGDRFSISVEPVYNVGAASPRFDFYNYWMTMHSWMPAPITDDGTAYYGNALVHRDDFTIDEGQWVCLEVHARLNPSPASGAGAVLEVWKNDVQVARFDDAAPLGYWIRDKFCTMAGSASECTSYPAPFDTKLDLQFRSNIALALDAFWPQNYITDPTMGTLTFDQMVVATARVGCIR